MYQKEYKSLNDQIQPNRNLDALVLEKVMPRRRTAFRPAAVITAVLITALMVVPAMAAAMPWILEHIAPQLAAKLEPVQRSDTSNGITMEVVAASVKGNTAEMVIRLEGESLVKPVGVAPSLVTNRTGLKSATIYSLNDYEGEQEDKDKGIYYYQMTVRYQKGISLEEILAGEITVTLEDILITGFSSEEMETLGALKDSGQVIMIPMTELKEHGFGSFGCENIKSCAYGCKQDHEVIFPVDETVYDVTDKLGITCAAYYDGMLHIQVRACVDRDYKDFGYWEPCLVDRQGNRKQSLQGYTYAVGTGGSRVEYGEYAFVIPYEELENYTIQFDYGYRLQTECEVSFYFTEDEVMAE